MDSLSPSGYSFLSAQTEQDGQQTSTYSLQIVMMTSPLSEWIEVILLLSKVNSGQSILPQVYRYLSTYTIKIDSRLLTNSTYNFTNMTNDLSLEQGKSATYQIMQILLLLLIKNEKRIIHPASRFMFTNCIKTDRRSLGKTTANITSDLSTE